MSLPIGFQINYFSSFNWHALVLMGSRSIWYQTKTWKKKKVRSATDFSLGHFCEIDETTGEFQRFLQNSRPKTKIAVHSEELETSVFHQIVTTVMVNRLRKKCGSSLGDDWMVVEKPRQTAIGAFGSAATVSVKGSVKVPHRSQKSCFYTPT